MDNKIRNDIIERLLKLDEEISLIFDDDNYYEIIIVGGSALLLINKLSRATFDIDAIRCSKELKPFMEKYDINDNVISYRNSFSDDFYNRKIKIDIPTKKINVYTASLEDIVISKLSSNRGKDSEDIRSPMVIESLDWDLLDEIVNSDDFKDNMLTEHQYNMFMYDYRDYREEFHPWES